MDFLSGTLLGFFLPIKNVRDKFDNFEPDVNEWKKKSKMSFLSYLGHSRPLKWMLDVNKESFYNQTFCFAVIIHSSRVKYRLFKIRLSF